jgi:hypothetical protein
MNIIQSTPSPQDISGSPSTGKKISKLVADLSKRIIKRQTPEELAQKHIIPGTFITYNYTLFLMFIFYRRSSFSNNIQ